MIKFCIIRELMLRLYPEVQEPGVDTEFLIDQLNVAAGDRATVLGCGAGAIPLALAARGSDVYAIDVNEGAVKATLANAASNGLADRVKGERVDLEEFLQRGATWDHIVSSPPQLPTPPGSARDDWIGMAHNGGPDGRAVLERILEFAPLALRSGGRLQLTHLDFIGLDRTLDTLTEAGLDVRLSEPLIKQMGFLSFERRATIPAVANQKAYGVHIVTATRGS